MATFTFYKEQKIIEVDLPTTEITVQEILDAIRDFEDNQINLDIPQIAEASGKEDLGGGVLVGITLKLLGGWTLRFAARPGPDWVSCRVSGGNLVALDTTNTTFVNPITDSAYVQVTISTSASPTIQTLEIEELKYRIESQRGSQAAMGNIVYWSPYDGSDTKDGTTEAKAVATFSRCQEVLSGYATQGEGDIVFCLAHDPAGITYATENIVLTATLDASLQIRGPGSEFIISPANFDEPNILIGQNGICILGIYLSGGTISAGSGCGIELLHSDYFSLQDIRISKYGGNGIRANYVERGSFENIEVDHCYNHGIEFSGSEYCNFQGPCTIHYCSGTGLNIVTSSEGIRVVDGIKIYENEKYGIYIDSTSQETYVHGDSTIFSNVSGNILDLGIQSYIGRSLGTQTTEYIQNMIAKTDVGNTYYWDPISGDDTQDGVIAERAVKTWSRVHNLIIDGNNDQIFTIPYHTSSIFTEFIDISKSHLKVYGPGTDVTLLPTNSDAFGIRISGNSTLTDIHLLNFSVNMNAGSGNNIELYDTSHVTLTNINASSGNYGIYSKNSTNFTINDCEIDDLIQNCIYLEDSSYGAIENCIIGFSTQNGLHIAGNGLKNKIDNNLILNNDGYGIYIDAGTSGSGTQYTYITNSNEIRGNTSGNINDLGYKTYNEWATRISEISGSSASIEPSSISAGSLDALIYYDVATVPDLNNITGVSATLPQDQLDYIASSISGAVVSGIGTWGDLRWSKVYGIPLAQWDILITQDPENQ